MRRAVDLGRFVMYGDQLAFEPAFEGTLDIEAGADVDLRVGYLVREGSLRSERFDIRVTTEVATATPETTRIQMEDKPGVEDVLKGEIRHPAHFDAAGDHPLVITIEATWKTAGWGGRSDYRSVEAKHVERATVRVK